MSFVPSNFTLVFAEYMFMFYSDANVIISVSRPFITMGYATCFYVMCAWGE